MGEREIRIQAIINPVSGVGSKRKIPRMIEEVCARRGGCSLEIAFTRYAGHASELTREVLRSGADYIFAVGGDGTVNEIARAMLHSGARWVSSRKARETGWRASCISRWTCGRRST